MSQLNTPPSPTRDEYIDQQLKPSPASDEKACPICCDSWGSQQIIRTHCGHVFHRDCFLAWLGKEDMHSANSCPNCRAVCFPKAQSQAESGLSLDMSFLYNTMRTDYVSRLPADRLKSPDNHAVDDETMLRLAFGEDEVD